MARQVYLLLVIVAVMATVSADKCVLHINAIDVKLFEKHDDAKFCRQLDANAVVAWGFDTLNGERNIKVEMHAATTGWVMWGINDVAKLDGADVAVFAVKGSDVFLKDAYFPKNSGAFPPTSDKKNNWTFNQKRQEALGGKTITSMQFTRPVIAKDDKKEEVPIDRPITNVDLYMVWAYAAKDAAYPTGVDQVLSPAKQGTLQVNLENASAGPAKLSPLLLAIVAIVVIVRT